METKYAQQFRSEGEEHVAKEEARKKEILRQKKEYARKLKDQVRFSLGCSFYNHPMFKNSYLLWFAEGFVRPCLTDSSLHWFHFERLFYGQHLFMPKSRSIEILRCWRHCVELTRSLPSIPTERSGTTTANIQQYQLVFFGTDEGDQGRPQDGPDDRHGAPNERGPPASFAGEQRSPGENKVQ